MSEEIETKEVVYHVLSGLVRQGILGVRAENAETQEKRHAQEEAAIRKSENLICHELGDHVKSYVAVYDVAATVAACLSSGWIKAHVGDLSNSGEIDIRRKEDLIMDLFNISNAVSRRAREVDGSICPGSSGTGEDFVSRGFRFGIILGDKILCAMPHTRMSSRKMLEILADLNKIPNFSPSLRRVRCEGR